MEYRVSASTQLTKPQLTHILLSWYHPIPQKPGFVSGQAVKNYDGQTRGRSPSAPKPPFTAFRFLDTIPPPLQSSPLAGCILPVTTHLSFTATEFSIGLVGVKLQKTSDLGRFQQDLFFWQDYDVLLVNRVSGHYRWLKLKKDWDNPQLADPPKVGLGRFTAGYQPGTLNVSSMTVGEKLVAVIWKTIPQVEPEVAEALKGLLTPESLGWMAAFGTVYVASMFTGIGEIATAIVGTAAGLLAICGAYFMGESIVKGIALLREVYTTTDSARSEPDLDRAATLLAQAIATLGVSVVVGMLTKKAGGKFKEIVEKKAAVVGNPPPAPGISVEKPIAAAPKPKPREALPKSPTLNAADIDAKRGGHSRAEHGSQITSAQHDTRLRTGQKPSGVTPLDKKGRPIRPASSSSFADDAMHTEALKKTDAKLRAGLKDGSIQFDAKNRAVVKEDLPGAGTSVGLDPPKDVTGKLTTKPADKVQAVYERDPATGRVSVVTLYPTDK